MTSTTTPGWIAFSIAEHGPLNHVIDFAYWDGEAALCKRCGEMVTAAAWAREPCRGTRKVEDDGQHTT